MVVCSSYQVEYKNVIYNNHADYRQSRWSSCVIRIVGTCQHFAKTALYLDALWQIACCGAMMLCNN